MSLREVLVQDVMTTDVVTFSTSDNVQEAMQQLVERGVDAGPVLDDSGAVVGMLSTGDLIVEEARVHFPTVVNFLGVNVTWPFEHKELDDTMAKALGASVGEVMTADPITIDADASVEDAATMMHDANISRLPVLDSAGNLVGIMARGDIVKAIVLGVGEGQ
ncbi:MAG: CBS domain-containing protein [Actinomycetes bacterium]